MPFAHELNELVRQKKLVEGIERYYDDEVVMIESSSQTTVGKSANLERERAFEAGLTRWEAKLHASIVDDERHLAFNHWTIHYDHEQYGSGVLEQIAVQQWRHGKIVREAFYKL